MSKRKNFLLTLIGLSITLLGVLQVYWLSNSYDKAYYDLKRLANVELRNTLFQLRDSILVNTIQASEDSLLNTFAPGDISKIAIRSSGMPGEQTKGEVRSSVQVFVSSDKNTDSLVKAFKPIARTFRRSALGNGNLVLKITPDSLPIDSIKHYFEKSLKTAGIFTPITIEKKNPEIEFIGIMHPFPNALPPDSTKQQTSAWLPATLTTDYVRINPFILYRAQLLQVRSHVLTEIAAQIIFSATLFVLISAVLLLLYRNLQTQQKLVQEKDDLISNISHELKTPIATVSVALEAIAQFDNTRPDKQKEYLGMARQELTRLTSLTEKILLTSFAENQQIKIQYKPVVLQDVVQQTLQSYKLVFEKHEAHIIVNISETPLTVTGNAEFLTQALHNILDNALKYKKEKPTITIEVLQEHNMAIIRIHDNGIGIAPEYQLKIFDKFYRVPSGDVHNHKGYGLGLNFVKQVVTMHKGNIQVQSTLHAGSTFSIYLPLQHE